MSASSSYHNALALLRTEASPLVPVEWPPAVAAGVRLFVKRDDLLDPHVSGNKWRKLLPQLAWHLRRGANGFVTVGGQHSNHLVATAALCQRLAVPCIGYVRGGVSERLSTSLAFAQSCGMVLRDATRTDVRSWRNQAPKASRLAGLCWVPEGGSARLSLLGMAACVREVRDQLGREPDAFITAVGSGGTAAGLVRGSQAAEVYGMQVVQDGEVRERMMALLAAAPAAERLVLRDAALGGFASGEPVVLQTLLDFEARNRIPLDPLYTAKALLELETLLWRGHFRPGATLVFVHTGGLQGKAAWLERYYPEVILSSHLKESSW